MAKIRYVMFGLCIFICFWISASANSSAVISGNSSVVINNSITITGKIYSTSPLFFIEGELKCSGAGVNASKSIKLETMDNTIKSKSESLTIKPTATGTVKCTVSGKVSGAENSNWTNVSTSKDISVVSNNNSSNKSSNNNQKTDDKSSVNTLKSLSVEGQTISPSFDKDKTDYTLTVSNDVKKIKINAEVADSKATLSGIGEKELKEGENNFAIIVKAENGEEKTYNLKVTVDAKAITVKVKGKEYTIIKNKEELPKLSIEHEDLTLQIEDQDVPAYRIDKLNYVLIGLKDDKGKIKLFKFDSFKDPDKPFKYTLFNLFVSKELNISYLDFPSKLVPKNYKKYKEEINGEKVTVYKLNKNSNYSLFYGINLETGKKNIYKYDKSEGTMQIYNNDENKPLEKQMELYEYIILGLIILASLFLIIIIIVSITKHKKIKKILNHYNKKLSEVSTNSNVK